MKHEESTIQIHCVRWFNLAFPEYQGLLYSVPNGGQRNAITAKIMKAEGVVSGVSDLNLDVAKNGYHGLRIEMKTAKGKQSENQKIWQAKVEKQGYKYVVCHSEDEFVKAVKDYLMR